MTSTHPPSKIVILTETRIAKQWTDVHFLWWLLSKIYLFLLLWRTVLMTVSKHWTLKVEVDHRPVATLPGSMGGGRHPQKWTFWTPKVDFLNLTRLLSNKNLNFWPILWLKVDRLPDLGGGVRRTPGAPPGYGPGWSNKISYIKKKKKKKRKKSLPSGKTFGKVCELLCTKYLYHQGSSMDDSCSSLWKTTEVAALADFHSDVDILWKSYAPESLLANWKIIN